MSPDSLLSGLPSCSHLTMSRAKMRLRLSWLIELSGFAPLTMTAMPSCASTHSLSLSSMLPKPPFFSSEFSSGLTCRQDIPRSQLPLSMSSKTVAEESHSRTSSVTRVSLRAMSPLTFSSPVVSHCPVVSLSSGSATPSFFRNSLTNLRTGSHPSTFGARMLSVTSRAGVVEPPESTTQTRPPAKSKNPGIATQRCFFFFFSSSSSSSETSTDSLSVCSPPTPPRPPPAPSRGSGPRGSPPRPGTALWSTSPPAAGFDAGGAVRG